MNNRLERHVERQVCDWLKNHGYFVFKVPMAGYFDANKGVFRKHQSPYVINGIPDLICLIQGIFVGFEVKSSTGRQTEAQKDFQRLMERHGGKYFLVRSVEDVENALREI